MLDAGCGIGEFSLHLASRCNQLDVVDAHEPYVLNTKRRLCEFHNVSYHVGELLYWLPLQTYKHWDVAVCVDVIEHLEDPERLCRMLRRRP